MTEKEEALMLLAASIDEFLAGLDGVAPAAYLASPSPGRWSLAENAEHTTVVLRGVERLFSTRLLQQPLTTRDEAPRITDPEMVRLLGDRTWRIDAPEMVRPKGRWTTLESMTAELRASHERLSRWVRETPEDLHRFVAPHPILGPLDGILWIRFLAVHTKRHSTQAEEIRSEVSGRR